MCNLAYISYVDREPNTTWVCKTLVPRLEAARLRVAVSGDSADPRVPHVVNVERGVEQAKRTVAVPIANWPVDHAGYDTPPPRRARV